MELNETSRIITPMIEAPKEPEDTNPYLPLNKDYYGLTLFGFWLSQKELSLCEHVDEKVRDH